MSVFEFSIPTKIEFGMDSMARLGYFTHMLGDRVLLISEHVATQSGINREIENILKGKGIQSILYDGIFQNADSAIIDEVALIARKSKSNVVIGIGGMRACSIAKMVAFLCRNEGEVQDYIHGREGNGRRVPYIEIPTVFREVYALTDAMFLTDVSDQSNRVLKLRGLGTDVLVVDPAVISGLSIETAVYTALDILSLSIEGYISLRIIPLVEPVLLRGVEIISSHLHRYIANPLDVTIREKLCTAGLFTAIANIITGFGISFALAMGMNGKNRVSKSVMSAILLPSMVEFNLSAAAGRFAKIARVMGKDVKSLPEADAALLAVEAVREFKRSIGIPLYERLNQLGLQKDDLAEAAEVAIRFEDINNLPRKASFENLMEILEKNF